jgi:outer membrane protein OmpA-like peptidoglycan-associated protein
VIVVPPARSQPTSDSRKLDVRMQLVEQLNGVLATRDTPRGLVTTVSDSSFSGSELRPAFASRIARLATVLAASPDLRIVVEGCSDSAANDSQAARRAESVRRTLLAHGMPPDRAVVRGIGDSRPLVSNSSTSGREQNRRVEIVISGDSIGTLPFWDRTYSLTRK